MNLTTPASSYPSQLKNILIEPAYDKTNKMACAPSTLTAGTHWGVKSRHLSPAMSPASWGREFHMTDAFRKTINYFSVQNNTRLLIKQLKIRFFGHKLICANVTITCLILNVRKRNFGHVRSAEAQSKLFHLEGDYSKRKEFAPFRIKFFSLRIDSFSEGIWFVGMQSGSHKGCIPNKYGGKFTICTLRKHAYSNMLRNLQSKTESFQIKILIFYTFLLKT